MVDSTLEHSTPRTSGRAAFTRLYLGSLIAAAEEEALAREQHRQRVRLRFARRRLRRIREIYATRERDVLSTTGARPIGAFSVATVAFLAVTVLLLGTISRHGLAGALPQIEEIGFLVLAMIWFALAVACTPETVVGEPANPAA
ncbi:MAG: hypothetical protein H0X39_01635 [Actinobacteria bacterium]|nr:hypothetical protein [Actinomycetota bacterium]